jgi:uncharacterized membrane protein YccC
MRGTPRSIVRSTADLVREALRFAPGRPAVFLGLRAALATITPLVVAHTVLPAAALWASVAGFLVALSDKGGAYRARALTMGGVTLAGAAAVVIGAVSPPLARAPIMAGVAVLCGLAGAWGPAAAGVGSMSATLFAISLAHDSPDAAEALMRGVWHVAGGAWAMVLGLLFWPVRVYRPARLAVSRALHLLADEASDTARATRTAGDPAWQRRVQSGHRAVREALEAAGAILAATRRGRGESARGERLLVVCQLGELVFGALVALEELLETLRDQLSDDTHAAIGRALAGAAATLHDLADRVLPEGPLPPPLPMPWGPESLRTHAAGAGLDPALRAQMLHAAEVIARIRAAALSGAETIGLLHDDAAPVAGTAITPPAQPDVPLLEPLLANLAADSIVLRHALRLGVTAGVAVAFTTAFAIPHAQWVVITVLVLLQPHPSATVTRAVQRIGGTVLGGMVAAVIATYVRDPRIIMGLAFVLSAISTAVLQLNYALYSFLLTPTFVLLAEVSAGDWNLAWVRITNTLLGGALAFAANALLWPSRERVHFPAHAATAMAALRAYVGEVVAALIEGSPAPSSTVAAARRRFGLAVNNADASLQRLLAESRGHPEALEPAMTLLLYMRRFTATLAALATTRMVASGIGRDDLPLAEPVDRILADLEDALRTRRAPAPMPDLDALAQRGEPVLVARYERLVQQLTILHQAAVRWNAPAGSDRARL